MFRLHLTVWATHPVVRPTLVLAAAAGLLGLVVRTGAAVAVPALGVAALADTAPRGRRRSV